MKQLYFFFLVLLLVSCDKKKKTDTSIQNLQAVEITEEGKVLAIDSTYLAKTNDSIVKVFYQANENRTFWLAFNCRESLLNLLNSVEEEGLNLDDFDIKRLGKLEKSIPTLSDKELIDFDVLLTRNLKKYIEKTAKGSLKPKDLYKDWDLKENKIDVQQLLLNFQRKDSFDFAVNEVKPNHIIYQKLKHSLKLIDQFPNENFKKLEIKDKIVLNDTNDVLIEVKKRLSYWYDMKKPDSLTNIYDETTFNAVKNFQSRHGLAADGVIGKGTIASLNFTKQKRKEQIIANMERWRWYPRNFEKEYLIINIPDYSLSVVNEKDTLKTHRIIVGKASRSTPILSSKLSYVVFNPTWTIPPTILKEDVIPAATKNRGYFASKNLTIYEGSTVVSPADWIPSKGRSYRYVQAPGNSNSLGLVKIMFPNRFSVYLHDTNSRGYFNRENLSLSSGCVRVQNPFELTEYLLDDSENWNKEKIDEVLAESKTKNVNITKPIYLHILYWTAWSDKNLLLFRDDIYGLDADLYKKLRN
jgi:murein L,D-transpeptidase YcbB/YkuD